MKSLCLSFVAIALLSGGCASYDYTEASPALGGINSKYAVVGYDGPIKPLKEVGIITTDNFTHVSSINGVEIKKFRSFKINGFYKIGRFQLHVPPGINVISFYYNDLAGIPSYSLRHIPLLVTIQAGQVLHFSSKFGRETTPPPGEATKSSFFLTAPRTKYYEWSVKQSDGSKAFDTIEKDFKSLAKFD